MRRRRSSKTKGVPVRVDYRYAIMHDKFIIVDGAILETGSFNFTKNPSE
jgi:phosphatidylserine/phosphatidylglycerophosphate/cardiolipin synthase-like enzyme